MGLLENMKQDISQTVRTLRKKPLFITVIILTFGIGIGANTAIFSIINSVLLRPLPYKNADRLVVIWATFDEKPGEKAFASYGDYQQFKNHGRSFEDVAANTWAFAGQTLMWRGEPYRVLAVPSTENLFSVLGAEAKLGRTFIQSDIANGCTVVLAYRFWQNQLDATPEILNSTLTLDGQSCTVVGVMSEDFEFFPKPTEVWTLITPNSKVAKDPTSSVAIFARLQGSVSRAAAQTEVARLHEEVRRTAPAGSWARNIVPRVYDLQGEFTFLAGPNLRLGLLSWQVLAFSAVLALTTGIMSGLIPAFRMSRINLNDILKGTGPGIAPNWLNSRGGKVLITAEVALSMILLIGAALLLESIYRLTAVPLSFRSDHLWTAEINLPAGDYTQTAKRSRFYNSLVTNLAALPEIEGVALSSNRPLSGFNSNAITVAGKPGPTSELGDVGTEQVSEDFMRVLGIPLLRGRQFNSGDHENAAQAAIVNQRFAEEYFPNEDPLGRQIKFGLPASQSPWLTIVGLVGNVERGDFFKEMGYRVPPIVYRPIAQRSGEGNSILIRTRNDAKDLAALVRREVKKLDARVPVHDFNTLDDLISKNFSQPRFRTVLLGTFAGIALLLAAVGLYGVLIQAVTQRTREIGIRMAVGAERRHVIRMVITQGVTLTVIGIWAGVFASLYLTRFLKSMLFGVATTDLGTLLITSTILIGVSFVSTYLPARRAARVDPILALKHE